MYRYLGRGGGGGGDKQSIPPQTLTMPTFEIPTGPTIGENKLAYSVHNRKARRAEVPERGSFAYDRQKGGMTREWADTDAFLTWLATEEAEKSIKLVVSQIKRSDSSVWRERRVYRCAREFMGWKKDRQNITQSERAIPSKKTGCRCCLTIKMYPQTDKILGKYDEEHDHTIGDENLRFTRLSDTTKELVMELARAGVHAKAIVRSHYVAQFSADGYLAKARAGILHAR